MPMFTSVFFLLVALALGLTLYHGMTGKGHLWVAVLILCLALFVSTVGR